MHKSNVHPTHWLSCAQVSTISKHPSDRYFGTWLTLFDDFADFVESGGLELAATACAHFLPALDWVSDPRTGDVLVNDVRRYEGELLDVFRSRNRGLLDEIRSSGKLDTDALEAALKDFANVFSPSDGSGGPEPTPEEQGDATVGQAGGRPEGILPEEEISRPDETDEGA